VSLATANNSCTVVDTLWAFGPFEHLALSRADNCLFIPLYKSINCTSVNTTQIHFSLNTCNSTWDTNSFSFLFFFLLLGGFRGLVRVEIVVGQGLLAHCNLLARPLWLWISLAGWDLPACLSAFFLGKKEVHLTRLFNSWQKYKLSSPVVRNQS